LWLDDIGRNSFVEHGLVGSSAFWSKFDLEVLWGAWSLPHSMETPQETLSGAIYKNELSNLTDDLDLLLVVMHLLDEGPTIS
jgi:hypothetical protein